MGKTPSHCNCLVRKNALIFKKSVVLRHALGLKGLVSGCHTFCLYFVLIIRTYMNNHNNDIPHVILIAFLFGQ
jgi:hypothetical protein